MIALNPDRFSRRSVWPPGDWLPPDRHIYYTTWACVRCTTGSCNSVTGRVLQIPEQERYRLWLLWIQIGLVVSPFGPRATRYHQTGRFIAMLWRVYTAPQFHVIFQQTGYCRYPNGKGLGYDCLESRSIQSTVRLVPGRLVTTGQTQLLQSYSTKVPYTGYF